MNCLCGVNDTHRSTTVPFYKSPCKVGSVALGVIILIGSAVATGLLFPHQGYYAFSYLGGSVVGILFIAIGLKSNNKKNRASLDLIPNEAASSKKCIDLTIGSKDARLDEAGIKSALSLHQSTNVKNLIIYGDGNVQLNEDPGFVSMNPQKVILVGARIIHDSCERKRLDDALYAKPEWLRNKTSQGSGKDRVNRTFVKQIKKSTVGLALKDKPPIRNALTRKRYHAVYLVNPPS